MKRKPEIFLILLAAFVFADLTCSLTVNSATASEKQPDRTILGEIDAPGDGILRTAETPFGTISGVICWDTNFHAVVHQAGRNGTDILLSPSLEFRAIDPMHAQMATFRAIENGVSIVRQADNGLSIATDPFGRTLAAVDHFATDDRVMVAQVPSKGVFTLYSVIGDLFGWLAVAGFVVITIVGIVQWRKEKRAATTIQE